MISRLSAASVLFLAAACGPAGESPRTEAPVAGVQRELLRVATFNVSLYRDERGALLSDLQADEDPQLEAVRAIIERVDPDILVLNEFDYEPSGDALRLFAEQLGMGYEHGLSLPSNTGVPSGADLDGDGRADHPQGSREYGNDAFGYGTHPGQYAIAILSKHPINEDAVRTFRTLRWKDVPNSLLPTDFYSEEAQEVFRLSSKTHADVPVEVDGETIHMILAHPTPPGFDGPEDRNGRRNHDEIRLLTDYIGGAGWLVDDAGIAGGLASDAKFFIAGDLNSDPADGDQVEGTQEKAISALIAHPRVQDALPASSGGTAAARNQGGANEGQLGDPAYDTSDFSDRRVGNLRVDYVLPSSNFEVVGSGVFWPAPDEPGFELVGPGYPPVSSDHRLVWVDVAL